MEIDLDDDEFLGTDHSEGEDQQGKNTTVYKCSLMYSSWAVNPQIVVH